MNHWTEKRIETRLKCAVENKFPSVAVETADLRGLLESMADMRRQLSKAKEKPKRRSSRSGRQN